MAHWRDDEVVSDDETAVVDFPYTCSRDCGHVSTTVVGRLFDVSPMLKIVDGPYRRAWSVSEYEGALVATFEQTYAYITQ